MKRFKKKEEGALSAHNKTAILVPLGNTLLVLDPFSESIYVDPGIEHGAEVEILLGSKELRVPRGVWGMSK